MAKRQQRICARCGKVEETFSTSSLCLLCVKAVERERLIEIEKETIVSLGYTLLGGPFNHPKFQHKRSYKMISSCGHEWEVRYDNFMKLINNAKAKGLPMPCGTCGPKHRMNTALSSYIDKYGRDYDVKKWDDYRLLVRKLSDITYRQFKEEINPQNHRRGKKTWHLDHKHPIIACFKDGWPVEKAASRDNLQMLYWQDNLGKSGKVLIEA